MRSGQEALDKVKFISDSSGVQRLKDDTLSKHRFNIWSYTFPPVEEAQFRFLFGASSGDSTMPRRFADHQATSDQA